MDIEKLKSLPFAFAICYGCLGLSSTALAWESAECGSLSTYGAVITFNDTLAFKQGQDESEAFSGPVICTFDILRPVSPTEIIQFDNGSSLTVVDPAGVSQAMQSSQSYDIIYMKAKNGDMFSLACTGISIYNIDDGLTSFDAAAEATILSSASFKAKDCPPSPPPTITHE